jgi:hypothetical protein
MQHDCPFPPHHLPDVPPLLLLSLSLFQDTAIEAESRPVLGILTGHDFQGAVKHGRRAGNSGHAQNDITSRVMLVSTPKVSLWPEGSTSLGHCHVPWWVM